MPKRALCVFDSSSWWALLGTGLQFFCIFTKSNENKQVYLLWHSDSVVAVSRWFDQLHVLKNTTKIPLGEILVMDASCFLTEICLELNSFIWQFVSYLIKDFRVQTSQRSDANLPHICLWKKVIFVSLFGFVTCEDTKI